MKRVLSLVLCLAMVLSILALVTSCKKKDPAPVEEKVEVKLGPFTYNTYSTALGDNWNPHTWETNADSSILGYLSSPFVTMSILNSEDGVYQWVYEMATEIKDVTKDHQDDLTKYGCNLPSGKTAADVTEKFVYEIKLNPDAKWENGTPIKADDYIYSMKALLDPKMHNYRANLYYSGESELAGGLYYYHALDKVYYNVVSDWEAAIEAGKDLYFDVWNFWNAKGYVDADGNEIPQYISINDETVYGPEDDQTQGKAIFAKYGGTYLGTDDYPLYEYVENADYDENYEANYDAKVGCYKVDDYTIRYVTKNAIAKDYFFTAMTDTWLVYKDLYESNKDTTGELVTTSYGTSIETSMSYGVYKIASLQEGKQMVFVKNENWYGWDAEYKKDNHLVSITNFLVDGHKRQQYLADKIVIDVMTDDAAKLAFLSGQIDDWTPNADELTAYASSDQLYRVDETYSMSLFFNTNLEALKEMDNSKGNQNSVVLSNYNFRNAFSLAIDRAEWVTATAGYKPLFGFMGPLYMYNAYEDPTSSYRNSNAAMQAICNIYGVKYGEGTPYATLKDAYKSITGYNLTEAKELMKKACEELVAANLYKEGEAIKIRVGWKKGALDSADNQQVALLQKYLNAAVEGSGFGAITLEAVGNIADRYGDVGKGEFCIGYGGWGGAAFYPFRNFQVYMDPDQYDIHEKACWDPKTYTFTFTVAGKEYTKTAQEWSGSMVGSGEFAELSAEDKLQLTANLEEAFIKLYYRIPLANSTACYLLSYKTAYYTENYNIMYDFGGLRLMDFKYTDEEWAKFVSDNNGELKYE